MFQQFVLLLKVFFYVFCLTFLTVLIVFILMNCFLDSKCCFRDFFNILVRMFLFLYFFYTMILIVLFSIVIQGL